MAKRMSPYDYFANLSPAGGSSQPENIEQKINETINQIKQQPPEPKIVYVDKPYPVEVPKLIEIGSPNANTSEIPWGLITIVSIVGIISLSIVAIVVGGKKG